MVANERAEKIITRLRPRFSFSAVVAYMKLIEKFDNCSDVYICTNKGKHKKSVEIEELSKLPKNATICIGYEEDYLAEKAVKACKENNLKYYAYIHQNNFSLASYYTINEYARKTLIEIVQENGTYFEPDDYETLFQAIEQTRSLEGAYVEIGTYRGDSAKAALEYIKQSGITKKSYFLDTYAGFDYGAAATSQDALWAGSHKDTSKMLVEYRLRKYSNWKCIKSNIIEDELPSEIGKISVCNIDVDMYEAIEAALEKVHKYLVKNGIMIAEDFGHSPNLMGAQHAINQFIEKHKEEYTAILGRGSHLILIRR